MRRNEYDPSQLALMRESARGADSALDALWRPGRVGSSGQCGGSRLLVLEGAGSGVEVAVLAVVVELGEQRLDLVVPPVDHGGLLGWLRLPAGAGWPVPRTGVVRSWTAFRAAMLTCV